MLLPFAYLAFAAVLKLLVRGRRGEFAKEWNWCCCGTSSRFWLVSSSVRGSTRRSCIYRCACADCSRTGADTGSW